jgi:hypothetical protein
MGIFLMPMFLVRAAHRQSWYLRYHRRFETGRFVCLTCHSVTGSQTESVLCNNGWRLCKWCRCTCKYPGKVGGIECIVCVSPLRYLRPKASTTCSSPKASLAPRKAPKHPLVVHEGNPKRLQCVPCVLYPHIRDQYNRPTPKQHFRRCQSM